MIKMIYICLGIIGFLLGNGGILWGNSPQTVLTIGQTTDDIRDELETYGKLVPYLQEQLKSMGVSKVEMKFAADNKISTLARYVNEKKLDIAMDSYFSTAQLMADTRAIPIIDLQRVKEKRSYIFVRNDSGVNQLSDLNGKVIAFEDPGSSSAYFVPRLALQNGGFEMAYIANLQTSVPAGKIGFVFPGSELNVSTWVFFKKVAAGALSDSDWEDPEYIPDQYRKTMKILYTTPPVPGRVVVVRPDLDPMLIEAIKQAFHNLDDTPEGRVASEQWNERKYKVVDVTEETIQQIQNVTQYFGNGEF